MFYHNIKDYEQILIIMYIHNTIIENNNGRTVKHTASVVAKQFLKKN